MNKKYTAKFKATVALEAIKADKTISQIASEYGIHPQQVRNWRKQFISKSHLIFERGKDTTRLESELEKAYKKIGPLQVEIDFLSHVLKNA